MSLFSNAYHLKRNNLFSDFNAFTFSEGTNEIIISIVFDVVNECEIMTPAFVIMTNVVASTITDTADLHIRSQTITISSKECHEYVRIDMPLVFHIASVKINFRK